MAGIETVDPAFKIADVFLCAEESTLGTDMKGKSLQETAKRRRTQNKNPPRAGLQAGT